jgi:hypothetical protein
MNELQAWITACRTFLKTDMGSYLLRSGRDESLLLGDLHVKVCRLRGIESPSNLAICLEVDSYGHYFKKVDYFTLEVLLGSNTQNSRLEPRSFAPLLVLCGTKSSLSSWKVLRI